VLPAAQVQGSGRKKWMGPSTGSNDRWLHRQNRNAVEIPVSSLAQTACSKSESASGLSQARGRDIHRVSIRTALPYPHPAV
jgi:hypothetical protein